MKTIREMKEWLDAKQGVHVLKELYEDQQEAKMRILGLIEQFQQKFPLHDKISIFSAPGRSEIGGNHTDHQHGRVLAAAIHLDTIAAASIASDDMIIVSSYGFPEIKIHLQDLNKKEAEEGTSTALIRGICQRLKMLNYSIGGFRACITSNVLGGSGLSSSACFEVLICTILSQFYNDGKIDPIVVAQISQWAENEYFGKPCGLMDQMACSLGGFVAIDFMDPHHPEVKKIDLNLQAEGYALCIIHTKGSHADLTDAYAAIPYEMKQVAHYLGKDVLRDVCYEEFLAQISPLRELFGDRAILRSYHFFQEDERAKKEAEALQSHDIPKFMQLVRESGQSSFMYLQNVYVSTQPQQQPLSVALAMAEAQLQGKGALRVHGGGFAGTIQCFVPNDELTIFKAMMESIFGEDSVLPLQIRSQGGICIQ